MTSLLAKTARDPASKRQGPDRTPAAEPEHAANPLVPVPLPVLSPSGLRIQRVPAPGAQSDPAAGTGAADPSAAPGTKKPGRLIVEDGAAPLEPGQMPKSAFIALLRASVEAAVQSELEGTVWAVAGCPWIDHWFGHYQGQDAAHGEQALHAFAPGTAAATTAAACIPIAVERVRQAVRRWAHAGEAEPGQESGEMPVPGATSDPKKPAGLATSVKGVDEDESGARLLFKDAGGARAVRNPGTVAARMGAGQPLHAGAKHRMELAFGQDFSSVRVHTDGAAAHLAGDLSATAFTLGRDIVFGKSEYQPGTLRGDALLAHELAHVVQQRGADAKNIAAHGGSARGAASQGVGAQHVPVDDRGSSLEHQADRAAFMAMRALYGPEGAASQAVEGLLPGAAGGLRISRCKGCSDKEAEDAGADADADAGPIEDAGPPKNPVCPTTDGLHFFPGQGIIVHIKGGKEAGKYRGEGGPRVAYTDSSGNEATPTRKGEYRILRTEAYQTPTYGWSRLAWGTELQDQPKKNDVYFKNSKGNWSSLSKEYGLTRDQVLDSHQRLYGTRSVPATWVFNDFGKQAVRYYRDVNSNQKYDPKVDELMSDMLHTTPDDEAEVSKGQPALLGESHGCVHIDPTERDQMSKAGAFAPGTTFIVHGYDDEYKCP